MPGSEQPAQPAGSFTIGEWSVNPSLNRLSRGEETVQLELKMMEVLVYLAGKAGELVTKRELIDSVWQVEVISDGTLTRAVALLRKALGDDARNPRFIETIPKRGYRLLAPVGHSEKPRPVPPTAASRFMVEAPDSDIPLFEGENLIGRDPEAAIRFDDDVRPQLLSGRYRALDPDQLNNAWLLSRILYYTRLDDFETLYEGYPDLRSTVAALIEKAGRGDPWEALDSLLEEPADMPRAEVVDGD